MKIHFYMNYMEGGGAPTYRFTDEQEALREAERLVLHTGKKVFTLVSVYETEPAPKVYKRQLVNINDNLPF
jgi:hypothetical protein